MTANVATVYWKTSQVLSRAGHHPVNARTDSRNFESLNRAVIFAKEELEESRLDSAWIVIAGAPPIYRPIIEQIYAELKSK
jgi:hypothetical protein